MPLFYWCLDRRTGSRLFFLLLLSAYVNAVAKVLANQPRPFTYDPRVQALVKAGGGGMPSGHTQNAVVIWGFLAAWSGKKISWLIAAFLMAQFRSHESTWAFISQPILSAAIWWAAFC